MICMTEKYVWRSYEEVFIRNYQIKFENINLSFKIFLMFVMILFSIITILFVLSQNLFEYYNGVLVKNDNGIFTAIVPLKYVESFEKNDAILACGRKVSYKLNNISEASSDTKKVDFSMKDDCFNDGRYFNFSIETFKSTLFNHFVKIVKGEV